MRQDSISAKAGRASASNRSGRVLNAADELQAELFRVDRRESYALAGDVASDWQAASTESAEQAVGNGHSSANREAVRPTPKAAVPLACSTEKCCGLLDQSPPATSCDVSRLIEGDPYEYRELHVCGARCKFGGCPRCGTQKGFRLSARVEAVVEHWKGPMFWTFTVDASAFKNPRKVYEHIKGKRVVGELVRRLRKLGVVDEKGKYFAAYEFQMGERKTDGSRGTEQIHIHLLIDAKYSDRHGGGFIEKRVVDDLWQRAAPGWGERIEGRPLQFFGKTQFKQINNAKGMAIYACAYLTKVAPGGPPQWFKEYLDEGHHLRLWTASRGFFRVESRVDLAAIELRKRTSRPERRARSLREVVWPQEQKKRIVARRRLKFDERLALCGKKPVLIERVCERVVGVEGDVSARYRYCGKLPGTFEGWCSELHADDDERRRLRIVVDSRRWSMVVRE